MTTHGGKREGAGRHPSGNEDHHVRCSHEKWIEIQKILNKKPKPSK